MSEASVVETHEPHSYPRRILLSTLIAISIWGTFTPVAAAALATGVNPIYFGILSQLGIASCFSVVVAFRFGAYRRFLSTVRSYGPSFLVASIMFPLRDVCFLVALGSVSKLTVTAIDALWPVFLVILSSIFISYDRRDFIPAKLLLLISAFGGATLLVYEDLGAVEAFSSLSLDGFEFYLIALVGAVAAAGENVALRHIRDRSGIENTVETTVFLSTTARLPILLYAPAIMYAFDIDFAAPTRYLENLVFISVGWTVASICFTYAVLRTERGADLPANSVSLTNIGALAYLSPVSNAVLLTIFFPAESLSGLASVGISIVILSNFLINADMKYITATSGTAIVAVWVSVMVYVHDSGASAGTQPPSSMFGFADLSGAVLAIIVSFTLWRLADLTQRMQMRLSSIGNIMAKMGNEIRGLPRFDEPAIRQSADDLLRCLVRDSFLNEAISADRNFRRQRPQGKDAYDLFIELEDNVQRQGPLRDYPVLAAALSELSEKVDEWVSERRARLIIGEFYVLIALTVITVVAVVQAHPRTLAGDLFTVVFSAGIVFLILAVRDYNRNRWNLRPDTMRLVDRLFERVGMTPYIPRELIDTGEVPGPEITRTYRTESRAGGMRDMDVHPTPWWMPATVNGLVLLGLAAALALLLYKHGFLGA